MPKRKRDMLKNLPFELRCDILDRINKMQPEDETEQRDKFVLERIFIDGMSTTELAEAKMPELMGRNHKPISRRRIQQTIDKYVPEYAMKFRVNPAKNEKTDIIVRKQLAKENWEEYVIAPKQCAICGSTENLELDHIVPITMCPHRANEQTNLWWVCHDCHGLKTMREKAQNEFNFKIINTIMTDRMNTDLQMVAECMKIIKEQQEEIVRLKYEAESRQPPAK